VWVVDVELNRLEQVRHDLLGNIVAIHKILVLSTKDDLTSQKGGDRVERSRSQRKREKGHTNLSRNSDFCILLVANRTVSGIRVVKNHSHGGLGDTSLTLLVNQILQVAGTNLVTREEKKVTVRISFTSLFSSFHHHSSSAKRQVSQKTKEIEREAQKKERGVGVKKMKGKGG